ncbi:MAG TPA: hypothetical protein ENK80_06655 [Rhodobacterales bacterium]|nr:hypothetical protein [Rhodobacterales bacterium]
MRLIFTALALILATAAAAQDCAGPGYREAMGLIEDAYEEDPIALFNTQLQINAVAGEQLLAPDGKWGPATQAAVCRRLHTYVAINGAPTQEYFTTPEDAAYFIRWMGSMARFALNPNSFDAPD